MIPLPIFEEEVAKSLLTFVLQDWPGPYTKGYNKRLLASLYDTCAYCGRKLYWHNLTVEHVLPKRQNGTRDLDNIVVSCIECNQAKAGRSLLHFMLHHGSPFVSTKERRRTKRKLVKLWKAGELTEEHLKHYREGNVKKLFSVRFPFSQVALARK